MREAVSAVAEALRLQAQGEAVNRPRGHVIAGPGTYVAHMQAAIYPQGVFGFKTYTVAGSRFRFFVYLYDAGTGDLLSVMDAGRLGQLRTGAATAVAARYMAREDASVVGVIGSGFQARTQLEGLCRVRPVSRARVFSPNSGRRGAFAAEMSATLGIDVVPVESPRQVVEDADILVTITSSRTPVFEGRWLAPGTHVTAAGGANEYVTELDDDAVGRAGVLVVDDKAQARIECGELLMPASRGLLLWEQVRELWQVAGGVVPGRRSGGDITLFKSLGMALWDVAVARVVYDKAVAQGVGVELSALPGAGV